MTTRERSSKPIFFACIGLGTLLVAGVAAATGFAAGHVAAPPQDWNTVLTCVSEAHKDLRDCVTCRSYSAQWASRMPELTLRNCLDPADPWISQEIDAWNQGRRGPQ